MENTLVKYFKNTIIKDAVWRKNEQSLFWFFFRMKLFLQRNQKILWNWCPKRQALRYKKNNQNGKVSPESKHFSPPDSGRGDSSALEKICWNSLVNRQKLLVFHQSKKQLRKLNSYGMVPCVNLRTAVASGCSEELSAVPSRPSRRDSEAPRSQLKKVTNHWLNNPFINCKKISSVADPDEDPDPGFW